MNIHRYFGGTTEGLQPCKAKWRSGFDAHRWLCGHNAHNIKRRNLLVGLSRGDSYESNEPCHSSFVILPIVILPGFLTPSSSPMYATMARNLARYMEEEWERQAVVRISKMGYGDWFHIIRGGDFSTYLNRAYDTVAELFEEYGQVRIVGHSAGGWVARLLLGDIPYQKRVYNAKTMVNTLVTLGTPHYSLEQYPFGRIDESIDVSHIHASDAILQHIKTSSLQYCNHIYPRGDAFEPDTTIVCVAGDGISSSSSYMTYQSYKSGCGRGSVRGDGVTPLQIALLPHASQTIVLDDVAHDEYGEYDAVKRWAHTLVTTIH